jgi:hypothetical protein
MKTNENKLLNTNRNKQLKTITNIDDTKLKVAREALLHYCVAKFVVQRECNANKYFAYIFFSIEPCGKCCRDSDLQTMDAGINNVIYTELYSRPKMTNGTCGTIVTGTIDRGCTVYILRTDESVNQENLYDLKTQSYRATNAHCLI